MFSKAAFGNYSASDFQNCSEKVAIWQKRIALTTIVAIDLVFICFLKWEEFLKESARFIWIFIFNFKIRSHNFKEIKYLQSWQNETLPQYHESKLGFFKEINRALNSKEIFSSVWSWGTFQTLDILLQISWKLQTENCVSSCAQRKGNLAKIKIEKRLRASSIRF